MGFLIKFSLGRMRMSYSSSCFLALEEALYSFSVLQSEIFRTYSGFPSQ